MTSAAASPSHEADQPALTADAIVTAALRLVDTRGLDALTMRALAEDLGVYPTALYWHVGSKQRLIEAAAARLYTEVPLPAPRELPWDEWLKETARRLRRSFHEHRALVPVMASSITPAGTALPFVEQVLAQLSRAGFTGDDLVAAYNAYNGTVLGWVSLEMCQESSASGPDTGWKSDFERTLYTLDPRDYPTLTATMPQMANHAFMTRWDSGVLPESFEFLLTLFVDGLRTRLEATSTAARPAHP